MKTYEEIESSLKTMPCTMALHRLYKNKASQADKQLLAHAINGDLQAPYLIEFHSRIKRVFIYCDWRESCYLRTLSFYHPDVYLGLPRDDLFNRLIEVPPHA